MRCLDTPSVAARLTFIEGLVQLEIVDFLVAVDSKFAIVALQCGHVGSGCDGRMLAPQGRDVRVDGRRPHAAWSGRVATSDQPERGDHGEGFSQTRFSTIVDRFPVLSSSQTDLIT